MEFRELKTFQVVANLLSFNKAANVLNYAQSTVSSQIQSLENSLGETLFNRSGNKISLTQSGVELLKYSQRLINLENEILCNFKKLNDISGNLILKTPHSVASYYLPPILQEFQSKYPNIGFDFDGCIGYNVYDVFNAGLVDIAFLICDSFSDSTLYYEELLEVELIFVTNPKEDIKDNTLNSINDFHNKTILLSKSDCSYRMIFEKLLFENNVKLNQKLEFNSPETVKKMLLTGCRGIAFLPKIAVENELSDGSLKRLFWRGRNFEAKLFMIWKKEKFQTASTKAFVDAVRAYFEKL